MDANDYQKKMNNLKVERQKLHDLIISRTGIFSIPIGIILAYYPDLHRQFSIPGNPTFWRIVIPTLIFIAWLAFYFSVSFKIRRITEQIEDVECEISPEDPFS